MEFVIDSKFDCKMIFQQSASHNFIVIVLLGIIFLLFSMVVILIKSYLPKLEGDKKSYMVILVTLCLTTGIIMCGVVYNFFKNSANLSKLTTWKIFDQEFEDKMIYKLDENGSPEFPEYVSPNRYSPLLKIPNFIIINHRKMPTPDIQSPCVSICDNSVISGHALLSMTVLENSFSNAHSSDLIRIIPEI